MLRHAHSHAELPLSSTTVDTMAFPTNCECDQAGQCPHTKRTMSENLRHECQTNPEFRRMAAAIAGRLPEEIRPRLLALSQEPPLPQIPPVKIASDERRTKKCIHLIPGSIKLIDNTPVDPRGQPSGCPGCWVHGCRLHTECTLGRKYKDVACCAAGYCTDYVAGE